jgi:hypothetical protein
MLQLCPLPPEAEVGKMAQMTRCAMNDILRRSKQ